MLQKPTINQWVDETISNINKKRSISVPSTWLALFQRSEQSLIGCPSSPSADVTLEQLLPFPPPSVQCVFKTRVAKVTGITTFLSGFRCEHGAISLGSCAPARFLLTVTANLECLFFFIIILILIHMFDLRHYDNSQLLPLKKEIHNYVV
ncbi:hypothetical protein CEXT_166721 [Caerostris extrusa]|uniref:Uncharacterized protein n=1 Tax=Caerostris extrusa TaxID=172846 RepID=A0AAV4XWP1_CAEEX|nr:hypothetical protein CEXT_166721 [Caerostris extrusa]